MNSTFKFEIPVFCFSRCSSSIKKVPQSFCMDLSVSSSESNPSLITPPSVNMLAGSGRMAFSSCVAISVLWARSLDNEESRAKSGAFISACNFGITCNVCLNPDRSLGRALLSVIRALIRSISDIDAKI